MTPQQFLAQIRKGVIAPAYLFLGPEAYQREYCRKALIAQVLPEADRESGLVHHDLEETSLPAVLEDACCLSLFAPRRLLWISSAEAALPRGRAAAEDSDEERPAQAGGAADLAAYLKNPVEDVVLLFEAGRYGFEGDDKAKVERVRKFYAAIPAVIEMAPMGAEQARRFAANLARQANLSIGPAELDLLVEALGSEAARIATEIDKLRIYAAGDKPITAEEISRLVPEARASTIFALVNALGQNDRLRSLGILDTLIRQGEYLPLALSFLSTQFRLALMAKEAGLRTPQQIQAQAAKLGVPMWGARAEQVYRTAAAFTREQIIAALKSIYGADKSLRDVRPDDRVVMEEFVLRLTG